MTIRELHQLAYRRRCGIGHALDMCICAWPLEIEENETGHSAFCPAHRVLINQAHKTVESLAPDQCCALDQDHDGRCEIHERPGVLNAFWRRG